MQAERPEVARKDSSGRVTERITDMAGTLAEKVWDAHVVRRGTNGAPDLLYIDLHLVHEVTSPQAFEGLRLAGRGVRRTDRAQIERLLESCHLHRQRRRLVPRHGIHLPEESVDPPRAISLHGPPPPPRRSRLLQKDMLPHPPFQR